MSIRVGSLPLSLLARARRLRPALRRALLGWFERHRRDLPWRRTRDPYAIWISEIMLQQTRVEAVREHWQRFLIRFPDVGSLARASRDDVLASWSGLGYYRRAKFLHEAAQQVVQDHGGEFPRDAQALGELPGFGPYTVGAVRSIAFNLSHAAVDGNVQRVLARCFGVELDPASSAGKALLNDLAVQLLAEDGRAADWTQALMELGALVCVPGEPHCDRCPWNSRCAALRLDKQSLLPLRPVRRGTLEVRLQAVWVRRGAEILLERRGPSGRMAGLWQLPTRELDSQTGLFPLDFAGLACDVGPRLADFSHAITHHRVRLALHSARLRGRPSAPFRFMPLAECGELGLTGMARKALALLASGPESSSPKRGSGAGSKPRPIRSPRVRPRSPSR